MRASSLRMVPFYRERRENCWQVLRYGVLLRSRRSFLPRTARAMLPRAKGRSSRSGSTTEISSSSSRNIRDTVARAVAQIQRSYSPSDTQLASTVGRCAQSPVLPLPVSRQTQHAPLHRWLDTLAHDARCHRPRLTLIIHVQYNHHRRCPSPCRGEKQHQDWRVNCSSIRQSRRGVGGAHSRRSAASRSGGEDPCDRCRRRRCNSDQASEPGPRVLPLLACHSWQHRCARYRLWQEMSVWGSSAPCFCGASCAVEHPRWFSCQSIGHPNLEQLQKKDLRVD